MLTLMWTKRVMVISRAGHTLVDAEHYTDDYCHQPNGRDDWIMLMMTMPMTMMTTGNKFVNVFLHKCQR